MQRAGIAGCLIAGMAVVVPEDVIDALGIGLGAA
jgi:hypothetical protein